MIGSPADREVLTLRLASKVGRVYGHLECATEWQLLEARDTGNPIEGFSREYRLTERGRALYVASVQANFARSKSLTTRVKLGLAAIGLR
ncbi:MAG: hypothetical protein QM770_11280 [Tepidisphaeraceae bacterium]